MRTRKAVKNLIWSALYQVVSIICGLVLPRLILSNFGSTYNGVVNSATQYLSMVQLLNLGIAGATKVALYKSLANNDIIGTSRIYKATQQYMNKVAVLIALYTVVLMCVYPLISHTGLGNTECAIIIFIVAIRTFAEYFFGITNKTLIAADQSGYITFMFNCIATIANTILAYILISFKASVFVVYFGSSLVFLINPLFMSIYVKKKYEIVKDCEADNTAIKSRGAVAFHSIANIVHDRTDLVVLTLFVDIKMVSVYTVYYLVIGKIKSILRICTNGMEAAFGNMWVKKETKALNDNFHAYEYVIYTFTCVVFSCVSILILPFISLYTKGVTDVNYLRIDLALLITITEAVFCIRQPYLTLVEATGSYEQTKKGAAIEAGMNIIISIGLVPIIGINGVIIGTLCANLFRTGQYSLYVSQNILKRNIIYVIRRVIWCIITSLFSVFVSHEIGVILFSTINDWKDWIAYAFVAFLCTGIITLGSSFICYKNDLRRLFRFAQRAIRGFT